MLSFEAQYFEGSSLEVEYAMLLLGRLVSRFTLNRILKSGGMEGISIFTTSHVVAIGIKVAH